MIKHIKLMSLILLALALVLGVVTIVTLVDDRVNQQPFINETSPVVSVEEIEDKILLQEDLQDFEALLTRKLAALDVAAVNGLFKETALAALEGKREWREDDLVSFLLPHAHQAIVVWLEATIELLALDQSVLLTRRHVRDYRDSYMQSEWPHFMVYYQIAYLKRLGVVVIE